MKKILKYILLTSFALVSTNQIWQNLHFQNQTSSLIKVAVVLSLFELIIKPVVKILLLPINILTLGAIRLIINTLGLYLAIFLLADFQLKNIFVPAFTWQGFNVPTIDLKGFFAYLATSLTINLNISFYKFILYKKRK